MSLTASIVVELGTLALDVQMEVSDGEIVALLGPNGAGKTTVLRALAGLQPVTSGTIALDDVTLDDPSTGAFIPPERRAVGVVFQDYRLFPSMTVVENVAFGLRARGTARNEARTQARRWLDRVDLVGSADVRPGTLSGGQQQRVALARALAVAPRLLLLDEPLAALDVGARVDVRRELRRHLASFPGVGVLVTHDPVDAFTLADRIIILEAGQISQEGALADVAAHPRTRYVADLVGINLVAGSMTDGVLTTSDGAAEVVTADRSITGPAWAAIHPRAISLHTDQPKGSPRNVWLARVVEVDRQLDRVRVSLVGPLPLVAEITPEAVRSLDLRTGDAVWAATKATEVVVYLT